MQLAISFVEMGVRMTLDSRLPIVGYQIKMQQVLNGFFYGLLFLTLESSGNYLLLQISPGATAILSFFHLLLVLGYYVRKRDPA